MFTDAPRWMRSSVVGGRVSIYSGADADDHRSVRGRILSQIFINIKNALGVTKRHFYSCAYHSTLSSRFVYLLLKEPSFALLILMQGPET